MKAFNVYLFGFIIFVIGLAIAAALLGAPVQWILVGVIVLVGLGIVSGVGRTHSGTRL